MYLGMYKDCINQQKQLERKELDEEEELLMDTEKQTRDGRLTGLPITSRYLYVSII